MKILIILFSITIIEFFYSLYEKDGIYSFNSTRVNILTQFLGVLKDVFIPGLSVIGILVFVDRSIPHYLDIPFNVGTVILCLFFIDFLYYVFHRASHRFSLFWMFHFVHHSDNKLNLSVGFRSSWFEMLILFIFYSSLLFLGFPLKLFLLVFVITSTYQFLTHSRYLKLPKYMEFLFVTPNYHLIHHDQNLKNQNSNFGGVFSIWDRLFSTHGQDIKQPVFGIKDYSQSSFIKIHTDPIFDYFRKRL